MTDFYFTFGMNHEDENGKSLFKNYVVIAADDEWKARELMMSLRGQKWSMVYTPEEFAGQAEKYGLTPLGLNDIAL